LTRDGRVLCESNMTTLKDWGKLSE